MRASTLLGLVMVVLCGAAACGDNRTADTTDDLTQFSIAGVAATISGNSVTLTLPYGTDRTALVPTITSTGQSVSPASGVVENFTIPVIYTVTAGDASTKQYTVIVNDALSSAKDITRFTLVGVDGTISGTSIALTLPFGTDPTALVPTIAITGTSVTPASGVAEDFTHPVAFTVRAADASTQTYTATVTIAPSSAKDITAFSIGGVAGTIGATTVALTVPFGTALTALTPTITITGASVSPASGAATDFSAGAVTYTVTAADGTTKPYTVMVTAALNSADDITAFSILGVAGTIVDPNITLTVPFGTALTALTPTITITGASVMPLSGVAADFSAGAVDYTVTAANGNTHVYHVTVTAALNPADAITAFSILGVAGTFGGTVAAPTISVVVPFGTSLASLTPTITITGASVMPLSGVAAEFSAGAVAYTVTAASGATLTYEVTVSAALNPADDITAFSIGGAAGTFGGTVAAPTISVVVPFGTALTSLTPTITIDGASVSPMNAVAADFSAGAVDYTVTAASGATKTYAVTVTNAPNPAKAITAFTIHGDHGRFGGTVAAPTITVTLPYGTALTALAPAIVITGASVAPATAVAQDFSAGAIAYTVTAADGTTQIYEVTASARLAPSFAASTPFATGSGAIDTAVGDLNGDGKPDLVVANGTTNNVSVYFNTTAPGATTATFSAKADFAAGAEPLSVQIADLNGDGKPDVVVSNAGGATLSVLVNTTAPGATTPSFAAHQDFATATAGSAYFVAIGDLNGDGKPDLVAANGTAPSVSVLLNTTAPGATVLTFAAHVELATGAFPIAVTIADVNGDGLRDLAVIDASGAAVSVLLNTTAPGAATPSFAAKVDFATQASGNPAGITVGDLNGDGKPDLVVANFDVDSVSVLLNTTAPGTSTPSFAAHVELTADVNPRNVRLLDVDGDGRLDLAVVNQTGDTASIRINDTAPGATIPSFAPIVDLTTGTSPVDCAVGDFNGDGKPDLAVVNDGTSNVTIFLNTTAWGHPLAVATNTDVTAGAMPFSVATGDVDGDGLPDVVVANMGLGDNTVSVLINTTARGAATATYAAAVNIAAGNAPLFVALHDLNGDGKLDLVVDDHGTGNVAVMINTTAPGTSPTFGAPQVIATLGNPFGIAIGDLNGDGVPDIAVDDRTGSVVDVMLNATAPGSTTASFAALVAFTTGSGGEDVAIGDVNGDGRLDLVSANSNANTVSVLLNTTAPGATTPTFAAKADFATGTQPFSLAIGDLNGDGFPDLAVANAGTTSTSVSVLLNTVAPGATTASFATSVAFTTGAVPFAVVIADFDADGRPDLVVSDGRPSTISILLSTTAPGATTPTFAAKADYATGSGPIGLAVCDVNGDGELDLITANNNTTTVSVLLNE